MFCPQCGTIMDPPESDHIQCSFCPFRSQYKHYPTPEVKTVLEPKPKPDWATEDNVTVNDMSKHATIEEPCPKCAHHEMFFYTMQLRSVDEGSTVFYECPKCSHKYSQNN